MKAITKKREKNRAVEILEKAFINAPGMKWMLPENAGKRSFQRILFYLLSEGIVNNGAFLTDDEKGVVLFHKIQKTPFSLRNFILKTYIFFFVTGIKNGLRALKYQKMVSDIRPKTGWVGILMATDEEVSGISTVYEIKNEAFLLADKSQEYIYVETTNEKAFELYKTAGFEEYHRMNHPYRDITIWFLKRSPEPLKQ
ncbi:MAG: hypothetical protein R3277_13065 [Brumimicrobium sp.]|nr:hypothetical protein [Brumimicrobium sp.]